MMLRRVDRQSQQVGLGARRRCGAIGQGIERRATELTVLHLSRSVLEFGSHF